MHKHIERIRGALALRRSHKAALLALAMALYALIIYVPTQGYAVSFYVVVLCLIAVVAAVATHVLILPERPTLLALGVLMVALLVPGPMITNGVQLVQSGGGIEFWIGAYSVLVAGSAVASYMSFKSANLH